MLPFFALVYVWIVNKRITKHQVFTLIADKALKFQNPDDLVTLALITTEQKKDQWTQRVIKRINDEDPMTISEYYLDYNNGNSTLYKNILPEQDGATNWLVCIPLSLQYSLIEQEHLRMNHAGSTRLLQSLKRRCYFRLMQKTIRNYVSSCYFCQIVKGAHRTWRTQYKSLEVRAPGEVIGMDHYIGSLETTPEGFTCILVVRDLFSGLLRAYPQRQANALCTAEALTAHCYMDGVPIKLISDDAQVFNAHMIARLCSNIGISQIHAAPHHQYVNGATERLNALFNVLLKALRVEARSDWAKFLPGFCFSYNSVEDPQTGLSPHMIHYGRKLRTPLDHNLGRNIRSRNPVTMSSSSSLSDAHRKYFSDLTAEYKIWLEVAREAIQQRRDAVATRLNAPPSQRNEVKQPLEPGTKVIIRRHVFRSLTEAGARKAQDRCLLGEIIELRSENTYRVRILNTKNDRKIVQSVHIRDMAPYKQGAHHPVGWELDLGDEWPDEDELIAVKDPNYVDGKHVWIAKVCWLDDSNKSCVVHYYNASNHSLDATLTPVYMPKKGEKQVRISRKKLTDASPWSHEEYLNKIVARNLSLMGLWKLTAQSKKKLKDHFLSLISTSELSSSTSSSSSLSS